MIQPKQWPKIEGPGGFSYDLENQRCILRWVGPDGKRHKVYSSISPTDAVKKRNAKMAETARVASLDEAERKGLIVVGDLFDKWFAYYAGPQAPGTQDIYRYVRSKLAPLPIWRMAATDVKIKDVEKVYVALAPSHVESSMKKVRTVLGMVFDYGIRNEYCAANPVRLSQFPGVMKTKKETEYLDDENFLAMRRYLAENRSVHHTALLVMLTTGMRPGEALALMWDAVHLDTGHAEVKRNVQRSNGNRVRTVVPVLKTKKSEREVALRADAIAALRALRQEHPFGLVFPDANGEPIRFESVSYYLNKACDAIGVPRVSPHKLRHANGSMLLDLGMAPSQVADHLGHSLEELSNTYHHKMRRVMSTDVLGDGNVRATDAG